MAEPPEMQKLLARYQRQNAQCRDRLYRCEMPGHAAASRPHPLGVALLGAVLGAIITAVIFFFRNQTAPFT